MGKSHDPNQRETYDPFKKPENNDNSGSRGGDYGGGNRGDYGYPGGNGGSGTQGGGFYGPDYFMGRSGYGYDAAGATGLGYQPVRRSPGRGYAIASSVCGGIALFSVLFLWVSLVTGVLAVVFAFIARHRDGRFTAASRAGLILGIVALVIIALIFTYFILHFDEIMPLVEEWIRDNVPETPNGGSNGGSNGGINGGNTAPDTSGEGGRQLTLLPIWRINSNKNI